MKMFEFCLKVFTLVAISVVTGIVFSGIAVWFFNNSISEEQIYGISENAVAIMGFIAGYMTPTMVMVSRLLDKKED